MNFLKRLFGIHSPSEQMHELSMEYVRYFHEGVESVTDEERAVFDAAIKEILENGVDEI